MLLPRHYLFNADFSNSQMHICTPLGIKATFYLTPDYKARSVAFSFREPSGEFVLWASQVPVIEQDPKKGARVDRLLVYNSAAS